MMFTQSPTMRRWLRRAVQALCVVGIAAGIIYWAKFSPVSVTVHQVARGPIVADVMGTGTLEARVKTTIGPKISGRIADIRVDQNDTVSAGDLLVRLDDEELQQQVAIAEANVAAEEAAIERLTADKERAAAVATQARQQHARAAALTEKNALSQEDMDKSTEALNVAVAGLASAEAAISEGQRELVTAEKTLEYQRARLADTKVIAPFHGLIVRRHRDPGDVVMPGSAVLSLIDTTEIWVSAWVDETEMAKLEPNQSARVVFRSEPDKAYPGKVVRLGREADRETREFVVDVRVLDLPKNWAVGQRAEVYIETARKESVTLLPVQYVIWRDDTAGVFVSDGGRAVWRPLQMGLRNPQFVEVVGGVQANDLVIAPVDPRSKLTHGRRVSVP
jgi:HlyD family secretion protein